MRRVIGVKASAVGSTHLDLVAGTQLLDQPRAHGSAGDLAYMNFDEIVLHGPVRDRIRASKFGGLADVNELPGNKVELFWSRQAQQRNVGSHAFVGEKLRRISRSCAVFECEVFARSADAGQKSALLDLGRGEANLSVGRQLTLATLDGADLAVPTTTRCWS